MSVPGADEWHGMQVIARGANRICVLDPARPEHCLKYELPPTPGMRRYWRRRLRHALSGTFPGLGTNAVELKAWRRLHARLGAGLDARVAPCVGTVETPAGPALRAWRVADAAGATAPSLATLLATDAAIVDWGALCRALEAFEAWLIEHRVPLADLNAGNLVVVNRNGAPWLVCVDVKSTVSSREFVPLSRWAWPLMRRKIARRCARLQRRLEAAGRDTLADPPGLP